MAGRKSNATILKEKSEQHVATVTGAWALKNYGNTLKEGDYIDYYTVNFEDDIHVGYLQGESKVTKNMGDFNSVTFSSSVSLPFIYDPKNPESSENKGRFEHCTMIRDNMLEEDLGKLKELVMDEYEKYTK